MLKSLFSLFVATVLCTNVRAQVIINEIHYHPVEVPNFDAAGNPTYSVTGGAADFTDDVHEFVEIRNAGVAAVDVSGWKLSGGIGFTIPASTSIPAGGYKVIAKNPARIQTVYGTAGVLGPFVGKLSNKDDTVRLKNAADATIDSVSLMAPRACAWMGRELALGNHVDHVKPAIQRTPRRVQLVLLSQTLRLPRNQLQHGPSDAPIPMATLLCSPAPSTLLPHEFAHQARWLH